ncbi:MAG: UvrD-helicase domain-containing protein [Actinomycetota bacterium]
MTTTQTDRPGSIHPGPTALGRGVVVAAGAAPPSPWADAPRVVVDDAAIADPAAAVAELHDLWIGRLPHVVELVAPNEALRAPQRTDADPWTLPSTFEFPLERLFFLVWANTYDARAGSPIWWWSRKAERVGARPSAKADVELPDGTPAWIDGGPRGPLDVDHAVVHRESVELGRLTIARHRPPDADLAPDQLDAVAHHTGAARIVAPAGSGKTRVLTERIRHLVLDRAIEPELVTAVAYNTRAAAELVERLGDDVRVEARTLHSLGFDVLRSQADVDGVRPPRLLDEREVRDRLQPLVPVRPRANTDILAPYLDGLADLRLGLVEPERIEAERDDAPGFVDVARRYRSGLLGNGEVDFDELIFGAVELLLRDPEARARARFRRRHLLVDEFQDLTPAYLLLVRLLSAPAHQVFGVGDDDQVIYGYAGATPSYLVDFSTYFPGATPHALEVNYRCPPSVVEAASNLLTRNRRRVDKEIRAANDRGSHRVARVAAERVAPTVVDQVQSWLDAGAAPDSVAVLTRVNATLLPVQVLLDEAGVPCHRPVGQQVLRRTGVRAALAYLRLATADDRWSGTDLAEVANRPSRRISRRGVEQLRRRRSWDPADLLREAERVEGRDGERIAGLISDVEQFRGRVGDRETAAILRDVRDIIGVGRVAETLDRSRRGDAGGHADDLNALLAVAALHPDPTTFGSWLNERLGTPGDDDGVHLSSIHRVKGLEWDHVAVSGVDLGLLPHRLADDIEEERRILHVAMTRARRELLLVADDDSPSPFLAELDEPGEPPPEVAPTKRREAKLDGLPSVAAEVGVEVQLTGGFHGVVQSVDGEDVLVALDGGGVTRVGPADPVTIDGRLVVLGPEAPDEGVFEALRAWRSERARADGVPAYVVLSNADLEDIARRRPTTLDELADCRGIGPTRLERYGDDLLAVLDELTD